jgi:hypothetical protein
VQIDLKPTGPLVKWIGPDGGWLTGHIMEPRLSLSQIWTVVQPTCGRTIAVVSTELLMPHSREDKD